MGPAHDGEDVGRVSLDARVGAEIGRVLAGLRAEGHDVRIDAPEVVVEVVVAEDGEKGRVPPLLRQRGKQLDVHRIDVLDVTLDEQDFYAITSQPEGVAAEPASSLEGPLELLTARSEPSIGLGGSSRLDDLPDRGGELVRPRVV